MSLFHNMKNESSEIAKTLKRPDGIRFDINT